MRRTYTALAAALLFAGLVGCGGTSASSNSGPASDGGDTKKVMSCTEELTFTKPPERILMLSETDFPILHDLGLDDKIIARAGVDKVSMDDDPELRAALDKIPTIEAGNTGTGGAKITTEAALSVNPDVVFGYDSGVDRNGLREAGIPLYSPDAFCDSNPTTHADWSLVNTEIDKIATIFGVEDKATTLKTEVDAKVAEIKKNALTGNQTAVALYLTNGQQDFYAYGTSSMVQPIFEVNGLKNIYDDTTERVFDASMEALLDRNPDWIVVLVSEMTNEEAQRTLASLPGSGDLKAVHENHVVYIPFALTDPPTTLSLNGANRLGELITK